MELLRTHCDRSTKLKHGADFRRICFLLFQCFLRFTKHGLNQSGLQKPLGAKRFVRYLNTQKFLRTFYCNQSGPTIRTTNKLPHFSVWKSCRFPRFYGQQNSSKEFKMSLIKVILRGLDASDDQNESLEKKGSRLPLSSLQLHCQIFFITTGSRYKYPNDFIARKFRTFIR